MKRLSYIFVTLICVVGFAKQGVYTHFNSGEVTPDLYGRTDAIKFYGSCRLLENMFVWPHGPVEKRRGTYFVGEVAGEVTTPGSPAVPPVAGTYTMSWYSGNGVFYGLPIFDTTLLGLTNAGSASDKGGGVVGIPMIAHPYNVGDTLQVNGTTNYEGTQTVAAGTTADEIRITDTYVAESFDGTETVVMSRAVSAGFGRSTMDSSGVFYTGHTWDAGNATHITKVAADGTMTYNDFDNATWPIAGGTANSILGIALTSDESSLYLCHFVEAVTDYGWLQKFDVATGTLLWGVNTGTLVGLAMDLDASDKVYIANGVGGIDGDIAWFAPADGAKTNLSDVRATFSVRVDNTLGIVCGGIRDAGAVAGALANLAVKTLDNSAGDSVAVGGTYFIGTHITYLIGYGGIVTDGTYIYVLLFDAFSATTPTANSLYKYSWDGASLTEVAAVPGPPYGVALYFDLYGNLCVVNQDNAVPQEDVVWFYDTDLNYVSKIDGVLGAIFAVWDPAVGNGYIRGDTTFDGALASGGTPATPDTVVSGGAGGLPVRLISFERSTDESHIIEMGLNYMQFYKDVP